MADGGTDKFAWKISAKIFHNRQSSVVSSDVHFCHFTEKNVFKSVLRNMACFVFFFVLMKLSVKIVIIELDGHVDLLQPAFLSESHRDTHALLSRLVHVLPVTLLYMRVNCRLKSSLEAALRRC
ncbi:hypothetical protein OS493_001766 [Desmophyllum pertusum]|uniref:Uncharacterized protein n=1 Tax=Desmophyllum pertusum TaxID=174260 RepID=A0A9W9Z4X5_9CNID|nr:hypothetical protein OS493_001766 [Desmophyllum pertusum]